MNEPKFANCQELYWITMEGTTKVLKCGYPAAILKESGGAIKYRMRDHFNNAQDVEEANLYETKNAALTAFMEA